MIFGTQIRRYSMITLDIKPYKSTLSNSSTSVNFTESLPIVERYIRKTNRLNDARANYFSALEDYLYYNFMTEAPSLLRYPEQSFSYYDQSIHFNYNRAFPIFKNVSQTFNNLFHLPCTQNCDVETDLLNAITTLLSLYKTTPKHWVLKYTFETKNQCPFPINDFFTFNDTLYCWHPNATSSAIRCYCLSTPFLQTLQK